MPEKNDEKLTHFDRRGAIWLPLKSRGADPGRFTRIIPSRKTGSGSDLWEKNPVSGGDFEKKNG